MEKHLHIVCFDVPYPPDYGGAFEMFYKIKALHDEGVHIHLHCFDYGRGHQDKMKNWCHEIYYYERTEGHKGFSFRLPYIVTSRANKQLLENLQKDDYPILLEGIHCSYFLYGNDLANRKILLRLHNAEHLYYKQLSHYSRSLIKKIYYYHESHLLKRYEKEIASKCLVLPLTETEVNHYREEFHAKQVVYLPAFIGWDIPLCREGAGTFCLYHGNLSVPENEKAAIWLLENVFDELEIPFVIAGKKPSARLNQLAHRKKHTCLVANPSEKEMQDLIQKAHINILPAFSDTGIKFKLLNSVFCGRHCVVNDTMVKGTYLDPACHIAGNAEGFKSILVQLYHKPFHEEEIQLRNGLLQHYYNNKVNAKRLIQWIW